MPSKFCVYEALLDEVSVLASRQRRLDSQMTAVLADALWDLYIVDAAGGKGDQHVFGLGEAGEQDWNDIIDEAYFAACTRWWDLFVGEDGNQGKNDEPAKTV